jgi:hypothetical protein
VKVVVTVTTTKALSKLVKNTLKLATVDKAKAATATNINIVTAPTTTITETH